jgi:hypothetical protein
MRIGVCGGGGNSLEGETVWLALSYQFIICTIFPQHRHPNLGVGIPLDIIGFIIIMY